jgi:hypothetical protein
MSAQKAEKPKQQNKESVYWDEDNISGLDALCAKYPVQSRSAFINAAMRFYLPYAKRGLDGNLQPYTLENGPKLEGVEPLTKDDIIKLIREHSPKSAK